MGRSSSLAIVVAAAVVFGACGQPSAAPAASAAAGAPAALATTMTIAVADAPGHLDRQVYTGTSALVNQMLDYNVAEPLLKVEPDGKIKGLLAESWELIDAQTARFQLRKGVTFSDGSPWNAEVAKANFDRMMTLPGGAWKNEFTSVTKVTASGEYTLDIAHNPDPNVPRVFANVGRMFSGKQIKENAASIANKPIGTGPYTVTSFDKAGGLVLEARSDYWQKNVVPSLKTVRFVFRPEPGARVAMLKAGEADLILDLLPDDAKQLAGSTVVKAEGFEVYNLRFGLADPLTKDLRVRQAINLAVDRKQYVDLFGGFADPPAGNQVWPSWVTGWGPRPVVTANPEKAKSLIQEAGAVGQEITLVTGFGRWLLSAEVAEVAADQIRKTGLKVNLIKKTHEDWKNITRDKKNPPQLVWGSNGHEAGDATENFAKKFMCGGEVGTYCSPEFDALAKSALNEPDPAKRTAIVQTATDVLERDLPYVSLVAPQILYGKSAKLRFTPLPGGLLSAADFQLSK